MTPQAPAPFISQPAQGMPTQMMERVKGGKQSTGTDLLGGLVPHLGSLDHKKKGIFFPYSLFRFAFITVNVLLSGLD